MFYEVFSLICVSALWGLTNPIIKRNSKSITNIKADSYIVQFLLEVKYLITNVQAFIPRLTKIEGWRSQLQPLYNRPDIFVLDKKVKEGLLIDITIPLDDNIRKSRTEKVTKYQELAIAVKDIYKLATVRIISIVLSSNGLVDKCLLQYWRYANPRTFEATQPVVDRTDPDWLSAPSRISTYERFF